MLLYVCVYPDVDIITMTQQILSTHRLRRSLSKYSSKRSSPASNATIKHDTTLGNFKIHIRCASSEIAYRVLCTNQYIIYLRTLYRKADAAVCLIEVTKRVHNTSKSLIILAYCTQVLLDKCNIFFKTRTFNWLHSLNQNAIQECFYGAAVLFIIVDITTSTTSLFN